MAAVGVLGVGVTTVLSGDDVVPFKPLPPTNAVEEAPAPGFGSWSDLRAGLVVPDDGSRDGVLRFVVRVHNPTGQPVRMRPCPSYQLTLGESATGYQESGTLNCSEGPRVIESGERVSYEMQTRIQAASFGRVDPPHVNPGDLDDGFTLKWGTTSRSGGFGAETPVKVDLRPCAVQPCTRGG